MSEESAKNFVSLSYLLGALGCLSGGFISDWVTKHFGLKPGRRMVALCGLTLSGILFFIAGMTSSNQLAGYLLTFCVFTKDLALPVAFAVCVDIGRRNSGLVVGAMNFAGQLGGFFITLIFGIIITKQETSVILYT